MESFFLFVWTFVAAFALVASSFYLDDGSALPGQPQYYLMADADTSHVGPNDELKRTQRSFWKKLFKNSGLPDLFGDEEDDCTPCCNYNNNYNYDVGNGDGYSMGSPPANANNPYYRPFQSFQPLPQLRVPSPFGFLNRQLGGLGIGGGGGGYGPRGGGGSYGGRGGGTGYSGNGPQNNGYGGGPGGQNKGGQSSGGYGGNNDGASYGNSGGVSGGSGYGVNRGGEKGANGGYDGGSAGYSGQTGGYTEGSGKNPSGGYSDNSDGGSYGDSKSSGNQSNSGYDKASGDQSSGGYSADSDGQSSGGYGSDGGKSTGDYNSNSGGSSDSGSGGYNSNSKSDGTSIEYQLPGPSSAPESDNVYSDGGRSQYNSAPSQPGYGSGNSGYGQSQQPQIIYQPIIYVSPQYRPQSEYDSNTKGENNADYEQQSPETKGEYGQNKEESENGGYEKNKENTNDGGYEQNNDGASGYNDNKSDNYETDAPAKAHTPTTCQGSCGVMPCSIPIFGIAPLFGACQGCGASSYHGGASSYGMPYGMNTGPIQQPMPSSSYGQNSAQTYGKPEGPPQQVPSNYQHATSVQNSQQPYGSPAAVNQGGGYSCGHRQSAGNGYSSNIPALPPQSYGEPSTYNAIPSNSLPDASYRSQSPSQGITAVSHIHTVFTPISTARSYNSGPSNGPSYNGGVPATETYSMPGPVATPCTAPLTMADQPYRECPELFADYNIRMAQYNNAQVIGY